MWMPCQVMVVLCRCSAKGSTAFTVQAEMNRQPAFFGIRGFTASFNQVTISISATWLVKSPDYKDFCAVKVGNGAYSYSEGETMVIVELELCKVSHPRISLDATFFDVCIGLNFVQENPDMIIGLLFKPAKRLVKNGRDVGVVSVEKSSKGEHTPHYHDVTRLRLRNKDSYRLVSKYREDAFRELQVTPEVDLYASALNFTEGLCCSVKNSCYRYAWGIMGTLWANPPMVTPVQMCGEAGA